MWWELHFWGTADPKLLSTSNFEGIQAKRTLYFGQRYSNWNISYLYIPYGSLHEKLHAFSSHYLNQNRYLSILQSRCQPLPATSNRALIGAKKKSVRSTWTWFAFVYLHCEQHNSFTKQMGDKENENKLIWTEMKWKATRTMWKTSKVSAVSTLENYKICQVEVPTTTKQSIIILNAHVSIHGFSTSDSQSFYRIRNAWVKAQALLTSSHIAHV